MLVRAGENSSVTFLIDRFSQRIRRILDLLILGIMLIFMLIIFAISLTHTQYSMNEISPALRISMFIPKSSILFGSLLISIQLIWKILDYILRIREEGGAA